MSEHSVAVVRLDPPESRGQIAKGIAQWLSNAGVIRPNPLPDQLHQPSSWLPGPSWRSVVADEDWLDYFERTSNNGVDIKTDRNAYHGVENDQSPACVRCGTKMNEDTYAGYFETWYEGSEPEVTCLVCGWKGLAGDWRGEFSFLVGAPAVEFNNWPELTDAFLDEVRGHLGGRTAILRAHY